MGPFLLAWADMRGGTPAANHDRAAGVPLSQVVKAHRCLFEADGRRPRDSLSKRRKPGATL